MLEVLRKSRTTSDRKIRLFAVACCRRVWDSLGEQTRHALQVLEQYLDGAATDDQLEFAILGAEREWGSEWDLHHPTNAARAAVTFRDTIPLVAAMGTAR